MQLLSNYVASSSRTSTWSLRTCLERSRIARPSATCKMPKSILALCFLATLSFGSFGQSLSPLAADSHAATSSPSKSTLPPAIERSGICPAEYVGDQRPVSWKLLVPNILCDQKRVWTFPWHFVHGQDAIPSVAVAGVTTGLVLLDPSTAPYFRRTSSFHAFNQVLSSNTTSLTILLVPVSYYGLSLLRHDSYGQQTALLVGEAVADSEIVDTVLKSATRRLRPQDIAPNGSFADTWFQSKGAWWRGNGSFPSGHEIAAISVATVFARRYGRTHKWVPWVAYGAAGLIGFSRITLSAHFPSDVFLGAALGYGITRYAVLH